MISLVVTIDGDTKNFNLVERDREFSDLLASFNEPFEIIYTACSDYGFLNELRNIVSTQKNKHLIVFAPTTNINTQIYAALDYTDNGDVLLCTLDTNVKVLQDILKKHFEGADLVFVKHKENWFKSIFTGLGRATYQLGLKILGRGQDLCCDARVLYLNTRSVNTIILNPSLSKALRLVNPDPEKTIRKITEDKVYDNPTCEQQQINKSFLSLGIVALVYLAVLVAMTLVFPFYNNGIYTGWILLAIVIWLVLGVVAAAVAARSLYNTRLGYPITLNLHDEPVINIEEYFSYNSELARKFADEEKAKEIGEEVPQSSDNALSKLRAEANSIEQDDVTEQHEEVPNETEGHAEKVKKEKAVEDKQVIDEQVAEPSKQEESVKNTETVEENAETVLENKESKKAVKEPKEKAEEKPKTTKSKATTKKASTKASASTTSKKSSATKKNTTKKASTTSKASMITKISGKKTAKTNKTKK